MSKRHQASRRRSYGRRQHEIHERPEMPLAGSDVEGAIEPVFVPVLVRLAAADRSGDRFAFVGAD